MASDIQPRAAVSLIISHRREHHVSQDTVREFERAILSTGQAVPVLGDRAFPFLIGRSGWRLYRAVTSALREERPLSLLGKLGRRGHYLAILMGPQLNKCLPYFALAKRKSIYFFDAWPRCHAQIQQFAAHFSVDDLFFSSSQVTDTFQRHNPSRRCHWIPEGIDPDEYRQLDYGKKDVDVLQIGRKHDAYHEQIVMPLHREGITYLYEVVKGQLVFPSREEYVQGLARAKISICTPSSITHPERSGQVSTVTIRYLQSMISKCLVVGLKPPEMDRLFDYDPIIEIDREDPVGQLRHLLADFRSYIPLIEKNYETVRRDHTWSNRWKDMQASLEAAS
jgi:hypothetical protein